eukprot:TRINITY_DN1614_c0_g2_i2.p1 TRINITY_DN1614_c0_g2~~TRINITY_DN1614_c0_g2_i2.p1  ORF type:complete len:193 (+),score=47.84 TRINITY_DN1614_c0_g2_i2:120-698(+)
MGSLKTLVCLLVVLTPLLARDQENTEAIEFIVGVCRGNGFPIDEAAIKDSAFSGDQIKVERTLKALEFMRGLDGTQPVPLLLVLSNMLIDFQIFYKLGQSSFAHYRYLDLALSKFIIPALSDADGTVKAIIEANQIDEFIEAAKLAQTDVRGAGKKIGRIFRKCWEAFKPDIITKAKIKEQVTRFVSRDSKK